MSDQHDDQPVRVTYIIFKITDGTSDTSETEIETVHLADIETA